MWNWLLGLCLICLSLASCNPPDSKESGTKDSENLSSTDSAGTNVAMYQPYEVVDPAQAPSEAELIAKIKGVTPHFTADATSSIVLPQGERVLLLKQQGRTIPLASLYEGKLYEWWIYTTMEQGKTEGEVSLHRQNWVIRVPHDGDPEDPTNPWFTIYEPAGKPVDLVPLIEHGVYLPTRSGNQFYGENHQPSFQFVPLAEGQWQLEGKFDSPFLCSGSFIWRTEGDMLISATREFGSVSYRRWRGEGPSMRLMDDIDNPDDAMKTMGSKAKDCPSRSGNSLPGLIASLEYSPESQFGKPANAVKQPHQNYAAPGSTIVINDSAWLVLSVTKRKERVQVDRTSSETTVYDYVVTNHQRTWQEDGGKQYTRVYLWKGEEGTGETGLELLGSTTWFLLNTPSMIADFSAKRLSAPGKIEALQQKARQQLDLAEKKFSEVDSVTKIAMVAGASYMNELTFKALPKGDANTSFLGLRTMLPRSAKGTVTFERALLNTTLRRSPELAQRALSAFYITAIQSVATSVDTVTANIGKKSWSDIGKSIIKTSGQTALSNGLLTISPIIRINKEGVESIQALGVAAAAASGFTMRWRKMSVEASKGIDNGEEWQKTLNLLAGSVTQVASSIAAVTFRNAGLSNAIGSGGVLVSEIISGRSSPGLIIGQSIEATSAMVSKNPLFRPLAITSGKLLNAYAQFQGALATSAMVSKELDEAIALKYRQLALADAMLFLVKKRPDLVQALPPRDRNLILATVYDPEADFVAGMREKLGK